MLVTPPPGRGIVLISSDVLMASINVRNKWHDLSSINWLWHSTATKIHQFTKKVFSSGYDFYNVFYFIQLYECLINVPDKWHDLSSINWLWHATATKIHQFTKKVFSAGYDFYNVFYFIPLNWWKKRIKVKWNMS